MCLPGRACGWPARMAFRRRPRSPTSPTKPPALTRSSRAHRSSAASATCTRCRSKFNPATRILNLPAASCSASSRRACSFRAFAPWPDDGCLGGECRRRTIAEAHGRSVRFPAGDCFVASLLGMRSLARLSRHLDTETCAYTQVRSPARGTNPCLPRSGGKSRSPVGQGPLVPEKPHLYELLIHSVVDYAIFMLDEEGYVASWNPGAERIKGYTAEEIIGQHFSCFYTPE